MPPSLGSDQPSLAPLAYQILLALIEQDQHGYGLIKSIKERTGRRLSPATGTVYLTLQRLEDEGLVQDSTRQTREPDGRRRRFYRITRRGRAAARAEARRLMGLVQQAADVSLIEFPDPTGRATE